MYLDSVLQPNATKFETKYPPNIAFNDLPFETNVGFLNKSCVPPLKVFFSVHNSAILVHPFLISTDSYKQDTIMVGNFRFVMMFLRHRVTLGSVLCMA